MDTGTQGKKDTRSPNKQREMETRRKVTRNIAKKQTRHGGTLEDTRHKETRKKERSRKDIRTCKDIKQTITENKSIGISYIDLQMYG